MSQREVYMNRGTEAKAWHVLTVASVFKAQKSSKWMIPHR
jgi:hypothetical protein